MPELILPDSNIYIGALRAGIDPFPALAVAMERNDAELVTCGMVVLEVCRGVRDTRLLERLNERFRLMLNLASTPQIWERATHLGWALDRQGRTLPAPDLLIAACALQAGATVYTHDAHLHEVPGLHVIESLD